MEVKVTLSWIITEATSRSNRHAESGENVERKRLTKGVISRVPFDREIDDIKEQTGAVWARRITRYANKVTPQTMSVILAFENELPNQIQLGLYTHRVAIYIPHPIRCGNCQKYGHPTKACRAEEPVCSRCSGKHELQVAQLKKIKLDALTARRTTALRIRAAKGFKP